MNILSIREDANSWLHVDVESEDNSLPEYTTIHLVLGNNWRDLLRPEHFPDYSDGCPFIGYTNLICLYVANKHLPYIPAFEHCKICYSLYKELLYSPDELFLLAEL